MYERIPVPSVYDLPCPKCGVVKRVKSDEIIFDAHLSAHIRGFVNVVYDDDEPWKSMATFTIGIRCDCGESTVFEIFRAPFYTMSDDMV